MTPELFGQELDREYGEPVAARFKAKFSSEQYTTETEFVELMRVLDEVLPKSEPAHPSQSVSATHPLEDEGANPIRPASAPRSGPTNSKPGTLVFLARD